MEPRSLKQKITKYVLLFLLTTVHTGASIKDFKDIYLKKWTGDNLVCIIFFTIKIAFFILAVYGLSSLIISAVHKTFIHGH